MGAVPEIAAESEELKSWRRAVDWSATADSEIASSRSLSSGRVKCGPVGSSQ